ncbi:MAG: type II secretion system F family protein [Candidatus Omnitrophota bacterium]|nr:MAG: type II secretion system F family protein [Candidatus Omnitrophota bacterium]
MAKFFYKAKKGLTSIVEGTIEALNKDDALNKLFKEGLHPISVSPAAGESIKAAPEKKGVKKLITGFRRKITSHQILVFTQKLAILLKARVELLPALKILYEQSQTPFFGEVILEIYNETREGRSFSNSLSLFPEAFSSLYVNIVKSGEAAGALDTALDQINEFLSRQEAMRTKVRVALAYPSLLLLVGVSSIFVLINFVVPRLRPVFANLEEQLPLVTKIVFKVSEVSNKSWWVILAVAAASLLVMLRLPGCKSLLKEMTRKIKMKLPVVKRMIKNQELAQFSRSLSLLLGRGVGALDALSIVTPTLMDPVLQRDFRKVCETVASGKSLSSSIKNLTELPDFFTKMIAVGEESGRLGEVLDEISRAYNQQVESDIALVSSLLEPVLILILGLVLGTIVLSILIPTFQITQIVS